MSLKDKLFSSNETTSEEDLATLQNLLAEREAELHLSAVFGSPKPNLDGEPTAVFPYEIQQDGETYANGRKEFVIPDDGLNDPEADLTKFIARQHGIGPSEVDFGALADVEGNSAEIEHDEFGNFLIAE